MKNTWRVRLGMVAALGALTGFGCGGGGGSSNPTPTPTPSPVPPAPPAVSAAGRVLLMHMDEPFWDGTHDQVVDSSGQGHHGTATPGTTTVAQGRFGRGGSFGAVSCVQVADVPDLRPGAQLTVSAWAMPNGLGRGNALGIITKRRDFLFDSAYALYLGADDKLTTDVDTEDNRFSAPTLLANGGWYHLALVYDGRLPAASRVSLYVNGALAATGNEASSSITPFASPLWVGCLPLTVPAQGFSGTLDEVAVWHRSLTSAEIVALANATAPLQN